MTRPSSSLNTETPGASGGDLRCSARAVISPFEDRPGSGQGPADALGHAGRLLVALDLDRPALRDLEPATADVLDREHLAARPHARAGRHRRREAHLVPAVVDAELEARRLEDAATEAVDQRQGQVAVRDRGPERALRLGALHVDVNPLVVPGELGEGVDQLLGDLAPLAGAEGLADQ